MHSPEMLRMTRTSRRVTPEIAATVREETNALAAKLAMAAATKDAIDRELAAARAQCAAAMRPIFRMLELDEGASAIVATEGYGDDTRLVIEAPETLTDG